MQKYSHYFTFGTTDFAVIKESPTGRKKKKAPMTLIIDFNSELLITENRSSLCDLAVWTLKMIWNKILQDMKRKQQNS